MGFFSKPPAKKPTPRSDSAPGGGVPPRAPAPVPTLVEHPVARSPETERRAVAPVEDVIALDFGLGEQGGAQAPAAFEVGSVNPGLCEPLENAALLFASGKVEPARVLLEAAVESDPEAKASPLAWLALFDLLQRSGDRAAFDRVAMSYVVQFERSAPPWEPRAVATGGPRAAVPGGYIALSGKLGASHALQIDAIRRAVARQVAKARLDLSKTTGFDDEGARLLADALAVARRANLALEIQYVDKLRSALDAAVRQGRDGGTGAWLLSLELLQWQNEHSIFEDRAIEFAVAFELSPPSWEPPAWVGGAAASDPANGATAAGAPAENPAEGDVLRWSGTLQGPATAQLAALADHARGRKVAVVDMTDVERVEFVCAGALLNAINAIEAQRRTVQISGASPIVRTLLLLIGITPRHFVR